MKKRPPIPEAIAGEFDAVEITAADWFVRQEFGLSPDEQSRFTDWIRSDPRHAVIFDELRKTSNTLGRWPEVGSDRGVPMTQSIASSVSLPKRRPWKLPAAMVAAAAIAILAGLSSRTYFADGNYTIAASTEIGGLRSVSLPDGSTVQLNTDSDVQVRYTETERRVYLSRGEASFSVARDRKRPFLVEAGGVSVQAVGTVFNVRVRPESVEVLVTEGRVRVDDVASGGTLLASSGSPDGKEDLQPVLAARQRVVVPVAATVRLAPAVADVVAPRQIEQALAWQDRRLKFESTPLHEVIAEFNRYNRHKLVIEDSALAAQKFGGTFRPEGYETLIGLLEQSFSVVAERNEHATILRRREN